MPKILLAFALLTLVPSLGGASADLAMVSRPQEPVMLVPAGSKGSWDPDAQRLAYRSGSGDGIEVLDLVRLTRSTLAEHGKDPSWSPDGKFIAFVLRTNLPKPGWEELWLIQPDGTGLRRLGDGGYPSWSKDSRRVYAISRGDQKLVSIEVESGSVQILGDCTESYYPAVSPDGRLVAYGSRGSFLVRDLASNEVIRTAPTGRFDGMLPAWSPDSNWVGYGGYDNQNVGGLRVLEVSTGRHAAIWDGLATLPAWTKDGSRMAFDQRTGSGVSIWMVGRAWIEARLSGELELPTKKPQRPAATSAMYTRLTNSTGDVVKMPASGRTNTTSLLYQPAPDFTLRTLEGGEVSLSSLKGNVVVLDFWASWCAPCRRSLRHLQALATDAKWRGRGLKVLGLNYEERDIAAKFMKDNGYTFTVPMDPQHELGPRYLIEGIPTTVVINREGIVESVFIGYTDSLPASLDEAVEKLLNRR
ncbi:MAG TPA: redoxin domain-containing protein [Verrucomicrobiota bacterium]|nr:hypothetical protein [Verrucomicrobiales bacterium]HRI12819.1 redoxin domain-containing protein [Verrucomicrobiota bacterium]